MNIRSQKLIDSTWLRIPISGAIGTASLALLVLTLPRVAFDYVLLPALKDTYVLPEWRYRIFDFVLVAWCIDGLAGAVLLFQSNSENPALWRWTQRAMLFYVFGFVVLVGGVALGIWLRSHGI